MNREEFIKSFSLLSLAGATMKLQALNSLISGFDKTPRMPALFLGHGNPMNAISDNEFVKGFRTTAKSLPRPNAILCISAHWETKGTFITAMENPKTIHDFSGFPKELFEFQYAAKGFPELARETKKMITKTSIQLDHKWGLDHGCWSVVTHLYPDATVPVIQLSIDRTKSPQWHYELAGELNTLREKGVLIIGSGNIVHNLGMMNWDSNKILDWAESANEKFKKLIIANNHQALIQYQKLGKDVQLAVPTSEHYLPLLYVLGLKNGKEDVAIFNDKTELGSISMTSVRVG